MWILGWRLREGRRERRKLVLGEGGEEVGVGGEGGVIPGGSDVTLGIDNVNTRNALGGEQLVNFAVGLGTIWHGQTICLPELLNGRLVLCTGDANQLER